LPTAVGRLLPFQKVEADLEYVEKSLKKDFLSGGPEASALEENPVKLLENLSATKARHAELVVQMEEIATEQKRLMDSVVAHLNTYAQLAQELQKTADVEVPPLTAQEQEAVNVLHLPPVTTEVHNESK
uniref:Protein FAM33A n=1 Tax=Denticeps clupeoides TaxID=299321 RepID=A0A8C3ZYB3_9TELE